MSSAAYAANLHLPNAASSLDALPAFGSSTPEALALHGALCLLTSTLDTRLYSVLAGDVRDRV